MQNCGSCWSCRRYERHGLGVSTRRTRGPLLTGVSAVEVTVGLDESCVGGAWSGAWVVPRTLSLGRVNFTPVCKLGWGVACPGSHSDRAVTSSRSYVLCACSL